MVLEISNVIEGSQHIILKYILNCLIDFIQLSVQKNLPINLKCLEIRAGST